MSERETMVPAEKMPPLIEAAGLPPAAATRTVYRVLANNPTMVDIANWIFASILLWNLKISLEDDVMAWPPDGVRPAHLEE